MEERDIKDYFAPINTLLIVLNIIIFVWIDTKYSTQNWEWLLECGALYEPYIVEGKQYYRFLTSMFLHSGINHIANNVLMLWFMGGLLEQTIGKLKYTFIYFGSGILAGIVSVGYNVLIGNNAISVGASGAIFGVVGALVCIVCVKKNREIKLTTRQMVAFVILSLFSGIADKTVGNVAHFSGFIIGFLMAFC